MLKLRARAEVQRVVRGNVGLWETQPGAGKLLYLVLFVGGALRAGIGRAVTGNPREPAAATGHVSWWRELVEVLGSEGVQARTPHRAHQCTARTGVVGWYVKHRRRR